MFVRKPKNHEEMQFAENLCESCGFSAWSIKELRRHMPDVHNDKEESTCQSCDELFEKEEVLRLHMTGIHEDDKDKKENKQPTAMASHDSLPHDRNSRKQTGAELGQEFRN